VMAPGSDRVRAQFLGGMAGPQRGMFTTQ
jgi:hypothetical protein